MKRTRAADATTKNVGIWIRVSTEDQVKGESPEHHERVHQSPIAASWSGAGAAKYARSNRARLCLQSDGRGTDHSILRCFERVALSAGVSSDTSGNCRRHRSWGVVAV